MRIVANGLVGFLLAGILGSATPALAGAPDPSPPGACRKLPAHKRVVRLNLKPNTDIADLVAWISSVTCKQFVLAAGVAGGKTVTIVSPELITVGEAYDLFLSALDSVGLTVYLEGHFLRVIEVGKAKQSSIPLVVDRAGR